MALVLVGDAAEPAREGPEPRKRLRASPEGALVVELSETHGEDGRLLRMFVGRRSHLRPDAREQATSSWLIRGDFFDTWVEEYARRYAPQPSDGAEGDELADEARQMVEACNGALAARRCVERLEQSVKSAEGDVHVLRDTLLTAIKELSTPRRKLNEGDGSNKMTPDAKIKLKLREQSRIRQVIYECLHAIWTSGIGGEVLRISLEGVRRRIARYESLVGDGADVSDAMAGKEWLKLKKLVETIDTELVEAGGKARRVSTPVDGRRTRLVIEKALSSLGGEATVREVIEWIELHPEHIKECRDAKLNVRVAKDSKLPVWYHTVRGALCKSFKKVPGKRGGYVLGDLPEGDGGDGDDIGGVAEPLPIEDGQQAGAVAEGQEAPPAGRRRAKAKAAGGPGRKRPAPAAAEDAPDTGPAVEAEDLE